MLISWWQELLSRVRRDIRNPSIHAYTLVYAVYGRKPTPEELVSVDTLPSETSSSSSSSPTSEPPRSSSTDASGSGGSVSSLFRHQRQDLVNHLVGQLCKYLDARVVEAQLVRAVNSWRTNGSQQRGGQSQSATYQEQVLRGDDFGGTGSGAVPRQGRRPFPPDAESEEDNDGGNDDRRRKRPRLLSSAAETKRLACPYYKRNPRKYCKWTSCPGPGWDEIHRVK